ncbi:U-box domain-containing protein 27 [Platanthera guangdongensis]|uniref:U-box domain-containing protein 27 n=1 Tax=Platanthera guangdongensis TaxID=2320717 RepID=A0ABR2LEC8_9ASPA
MMKVGREGMEAAMTVLWNVCHRFQDRRAMEAVTADAGSMSKILLLMQSNCLSAVRQMSGDLLMIFFQKQVPFFQKPISMKESAPNRATKILHIWANFQF